MKKYIFIKLIIILSIKKMLIRFYDNDENNFKGVSLINKELNIYIEIILINDNIPNLLIENIIKEYEIKNNIIIDSNTKLQSPLNEYYYLNYIEKLKKFSIRLSNFNDIFSHSNLSNLKYESKLPNNGISFIQMIDLKKWSNENGEKIVFFDWDRTLTVVEGFIPLKDNKLISPPLSENSILEYVIYIFGGIKRFTKIKKLFNYLHKMNVNIYILTNNSIGIKNKEGFYKIVQYIDPLLSIDNIFSTINTNSTRLLSNKMIFLFENIILWKK